MQRFRYFLLHKPYGVLCQFTDAQNRPCLKDYFPIPEMYVSGRLDLDSEGLLLLSNDGVLQNRITTPQKKLWKTYWVQVEGIPDDKALQALQNGVVIEEKKTLPAQAKLLKNLNLPDREPPIRQRKNIPTSWLEMQIHEGRNRQVRKMTAAVKFPTLRLIRYSIGSFTLENLACGQWRELDHKEISALL